MQPGKFDLALYRGDTYSWTFQFWLDKDKTVPLDLTGATVAAEFRDKPGGQSLMAFDCLVLSGNQIQVQIRATSWATAPSGNGVWDLEIHTVDGQVLTPLAGDVEVTPDVTHSTASVAPFSLRRSEDAVTRRPVVLS